MLDSPAPLLLQKTSCPLCSSTVRETQATRATARVIEPATANMVSHSKMIANALDISGAAYTTVDRHVQTTLEYCFSRFSETIFMIGPRSIERPMPISAKQPTCIHA